MTAVGSSLREAAAAEGGYVSRERVLELLGRDPARRLTGFRKPIDRAVSKLAATETGFPSDVAPGPLYVDYGGGVTALGFYVDVPDLPVLRSAIGDDVDGAGTLDKVLARAEDGDGRGHGESR
jgi:hypothetical protein